MSGALLLALLLQAGQAASPQAQSGQAPPTPPIVTASVLVVGDAGGRDPESGAQVFTKEFLTTTPGLTTDEALRVVAGLSLFRRSSSRTANPTTHGVTMRGLSASGASRGVVLLDGLPLNDGFGAWVTWTRVPSGALAGIDVIPGAAGDLFGSDALGGVIRLRTETPHRVGPTFSAGGGSRDTWTGDVGAREEKQGAPPVGTRWLIAVGNHRRSENRRFGTCPRLRGSAPGPRR
jgi:outer membrane receptor protein involved in Fe transport